ncbi:Gfo/Idh/MocA family protein [Chryseobacterium sp. 22458]|uniref:Gfo/Idh/MocA family protein n=1 Tax=Chryseobacterium sp. 22458 TaxID=3453921 RepID=UPI003F841D34
MNNKVKFAIVGYGYIGRKHSDMIFENPDCELVAVVDCKEPDLFDGDDRKITSFKSLDDLWNSNIEVDVVVIASPNGLHFEQASNVLDNGRHVVIEKPMALNKQDAETLVFKALKEQKHIFVVMQNRYSPPSVWVKEIIDSGILGEIYMVQVNCYWNRDERYYKSGSWHGKHNLDGGTLFTQFSHFIDMIYWLFGDITNIHAKFADFNHQILTDFEDSGFINFDFVNGGMGTLNYSTSVWNGNLESSMTIIAEKGSVKIGGQYMDKVEICNIKDYSLPELPSPDSANHHFVIENVVDVLNNRNTITTNALEGLKIVDIIERIYALKK